MVATLHINNAAMITLSQRLMQMHRSDYPIAVRNTINRAAFDVKVNTMPIEAKKDFKERQKNFFKANSRVEKAEGFDVNKMRSMIGFANLKPKVTKDFAVQDLEQQEHGGTIQKKTFIATPNARISNSEDKMVQAKLRTTTFKDSIVDSYKNITGKSDKMKFVLSAMHAGKGGLVLGNEKLKGGARGVYLIQSIKLRPKAYVTNTIIKSKLVYSNKKGRTVKVQPQHFMRDASNKSGNKMQNYFIEEANKRFARKK